jgi:hypothetical protein
VIVCEDDNMRDGRSVQQVHDDAVLSTGAPTHASNRIDTSDLTVSV